MGVNDLNVKSKDFLVTKWTTVSLDWRSVISSTDFVVTFHWKDLALIEDIKSKTRKLIGDEEFFFTVRSEYWDVSISAEHMHTMQ